MKRLFVILILLTFVMVSVVFADEKADLLNLKRQIEQEIIFKQGELSGIQGTYKLNLENLSNRLQEIGRRLSDIEAKEKEKK